MSCSRVELPDGFAIVCSRKAKPATCRYCRRLARHLCDWSTSAEPKPTTCDAPLCSSCADQVDDNVHHCRIHRLRGDVAGEPLPGQQITL